MIQTDSTLPEISQRRGRVSKLEPSLVIEESDEDVTILKPSTSTSLQNEEVPLEEVQLSHDLQDKGVTEKIKETTDEAKYHIKRFLLSSYLVIALIFFVNGSILLFGTLFEEQAAKFFDVARFYGYKDGPNHHLQRAAGLFAFSVAFLNVCTWYLDMPRLIQTTFVLDALVLGHHTIETLYFQDLRLELYIMMSFFLFVNLFWASKEYIQRTKRENLEGVSAEERVLEDKMKNLEEKEVSHQTRKEKKKLQAEVQEGTQHPVFI